MTRRHHAPAARILVGGLSAAATLGIVGGLGAVTAPGHAPTPPVEPNPPVTAPAPVAPEVVRVVVRRHRTVSPSSATRIAPPRPATPVRRPVAAPIRRIVRAPAQPVSTSHAS